MVNRKTDLLLPPAPRICVVMMSAVGDAVHVLPVITALKRHDRRAHITWVIQPGPASLVRGHPDVDDVVLFRRSSGAAAFVDLRRQLRGRSFDLVLDLQVYLKASIVTALVRGPVKLGFDRRRARDLNWLVTNRKIPAHSPQHVQDQYFEFLDYLSVSPVPVEWNLGPWPQERSRQRELLAPFTRPPAVLAIGSSHPTRMWLPERWAETADRLYEMGLQPVLVGGGADHEVRQAEVVLRQAAAPVRSEIGGSLRDLVALIEGAALTIGVNSAPMHISVAVGTPVISLLSEVNPRRTGPYRRFHDLSIDVYGRPGEAYPISLQKRPPRMAEISVEDVMEKVGVWRERYGFQTNAAT